MITLLKQYWEERSFLYQMEEGYYIILHVGWILVSWHSPFCKEELCVAHKVNTREWWIDFGIEINNSKIESIYGCLLGLEFTIVKPTWCRNDY